MPYIILLVVGDFPLIVYGDNGGNFIGAEREMREGVHKLRELHDTLLPLGVNWHFNPPAASHQGGTWERMIRTVRKVLRMLTNNRILTEEQLTIFVVEDKRIINDRLLTPVRDDQHDCATLSPSALLTGRLDTSLTPDVFIKADGYCRSWQTVQFLRNQFWRRWLAEYLPLLQECQKWLKPVRNFCAGDVVLIVVNNMPHGCWPKAIVQEMFPDRDGLVRHVRLCTAKGALVRDISKLCLLEATE